LIQARQYVKLILKSHGLNVQEATTAKLNSFATETQRLESLYQQKVTAIDELKKSLLHQAFSGLM
jgi:type I restriction enzyme, S subunit